uniref:Uncharacterized protein n=1 Tax=viral metagenome TaxID=1070528 RepID=A0A2V0RAI1_9ZZZZ
MLINFNYSILPNLSSYSSLSSNLFAGSNDAQCYELAYKSSIVLNALPSELPSDEDVEKLISTQPVKSTKDDAPPEPVKTPTENPAETSSGNTPGGKPAEEVTDMDNELTSKSSQNELAAKQNAAQAADILSMIKKAMKDSQSPTEAAAEVDEPIPNYVSFLEPSSPILTDENRDISNRDITLSEQNITNFTPDKFHRSIELYMKNKVRSATVNGETRSDISSYLKNFNFSYTYSICTRIFESIIAVGYAAGEVVFAGNKNVRYLNADYSPGLLGAVSEYILSLPSLFLLTKINDTSFTNAMSSQQQSKFRFPQIYAQIAHDINSSNEITQVSIESDEGSYTSNVRLQASIRDNLSCITSSCMTISFMMAKWAFEFLDKPMNTTYTVSRVMTDNVSGNNSDTNRQLNSNNPVAVLRTLLHDSLFLTNLTSNDPKKFVRALASLYKYQTVWYNYCGVKNYLHCSPYEFLTFRSSTITTSPVMFGSAVESGEFAITSRFCPPSEAEMNYFMLYSITINPANSSQVVQDFMNWNYRFTHVNYSTKLVGKQSFLQMLMAMQHGNNQEMAWPVAYNNVLKNVVLKPSNKPNTPNLGNTDSDTIAAASYVGIKRNNDETRLSCNHDSRNNNDVTTLNDGSESDSETIEFTIAAATYVGIKRNNDETRLSYDHDSRNNSDVTTLNNGCESDSETIEFTAVNQDCKDAIVRNRNDLFNNHTESELVSYLKNESYIITKIVNHALLNRELKSQVLLVNTPMQVREIPQIIIIGCLKLLPENWNLNISMRRVKTKHIKEFERNIELIKLGSNEYIEMSQSLFQLVTALISNKFCK